MKTLTLTIALCAALLTSCGTYRKINDVLTAATTTTVSSQTANQIITEAEKVTWVAAETFTEFLKLDMRYKAEIKAHFPQVHVFAEYLRAPIGDPPLPRDVAILKKLRSATKAFKANRTASGEGDLRTALATVKSVLASTKTNLTQVQTLNTP